MGMPRRMSGRALNNADERIIAWAFDAFDDAISTLDLNSAKLYLRAIENIISSSTVLSCGQHIERIIRAHEHLFCLLKQWHFVSATE